MRLPGWPHSKKLIASTGGGQNRRDPGALPGAGSSELRPLHGHESPQNPGTPHPSQRGRIAKDAELLAFDFLPTPVPAAPQPCSRESPVPRISVCHGPRPPTSPGASQNGCQAKSTSGLEFEFIH